MPLQEQHHLFNRPLFFPGSLDQANPLLGNAGDLYQLLNLVFDDIQRIQAKVFHNATSGDRANAFNQTTAEIFFNASERGGFGFFVALYLELSAIFRMVSPEAQEL